MNELQKKFGNTIFDRPRILISTGSMALDYLISKKFDGTGGIPIGQVVELAGESQTGKTVLAVKIAAEFQKRNGYVYFNDVEYGYEEENMVNLEIDHTPVYKGGKWFYSNYQSIEEFYNSTTEFCHLAHRDYPDAPILLVLDSLGMIKTLDEIEAGIGYEDMGRRAKRNKEMMRLIVPTLAECNATLLILNHIYESLALFGPKKKTGGGMAGDYACHLRLWLLTAKHKEGEGVEFRAKIEKNRMFPQSIGKTCEFMVDYKLGPLKYSGLLPLLLNEIPELTKSGAWYDYKGKKFQVSDYEADPESYLKLFKREE